MKPIILSSFAAISLSHSNCMGSNFVAADDQKLSPSPVPIIDKLKSDEISNIDEKKGLITFPLHSEKSLDYPSLEEINSEIISDSLQISQLSHVSADIDTRHLLEKFQKNYEHQPLHRHLRRDRLHYRQHKGFNNGSVVTRHFMEVWIGNPSPQRMTLTVSTMSPYTVMGCGDFGTIENPAFNIYNSQTFEKLKCEECTDQSSTSFCNSAGECAINGLYGKTEWTAYEARDLIRVGGATSNVGFMHSFACQSDQKDKELLGIVSMSSRSTSFPNEMYKADKISSPDFSLCFNPPAEAMQSGIITLGGYNSEIIASPMVYAENTKVGDASYSFYIKNIYLRQGGGSSVVPFIHNQPITAVKLNQTEFNDGPGAILNVETPYTLFHNSIEDSFRETWKEVTGMEYVYSTMYIKDDDAVRMPTILIQLQSHEPTIDDSSDVSIGMVGVDLDSESPYDVLLAIPPTQYLQKLSAGLYRTRISLKNKEGSILGANLMDGRLLHFNNEKVGFAEVHSCHPEPTLAPTQTSSQAPSKAMNHRMQGSDPPSTFNLEEESSFPSIAPKPNFQPKTEPARKRNSTIDNEVVERVDNPVDLSNNLVGFDSIRFIQFYFYGVALIALIGLGLVVITFFERDKKKANRFSTLSL